MLALATLHLFYELLECNSEQVALEALGEAGSLATPQRTFLWSLGCCSEQSISSTLL
jgi:hypothetical protein